jgi:hypothetical protein
MSKIWIKENRGEFTSLHEFGIKGINLQPDAIKQMILTPELQDALDSGFIIKVIPMWDEDETMITRFVDKEIIILDNEDE